LRAASFSAGHLFSDPLECFGVRQQPICI
jgi:hypothetical protein